MGEIVDRRTRRGNKRISLLLVLVILKQSTGKPLRQIDIAKRICEIGDACNIDIYCDRKTIGRHIELLKACGYKIAYIKGKGYYLKNGRLTDRESKVLNNIVKKSDTSQKNKDYFDKRLSAQCPKINAQKLVGYITKNVEKE